MARKKTNLTEITFSRLLPSELVTLLDAAEKAGLSKSAMIRFCVQKALNIPVVIDEREKPNENWLDETLDR